MDEEKSRRERDEHSRKVALRCVEALQQEWPNLCMEGFDEDQAIDLLSACIPSCVGEVELEKDATMNGHKPTFRVGECWCEDDEGKHGILLDADDVYDAACKFGHWYENETGKQYFDLKVIVETSLGDRFRVWIEAKTERWFVRKPDIKPQPI